MRLVQSSAALLVTLLLALPGVGIAQPTLTGVRATITGTQFDGTLDLDVTLYTSPRSPYGPYSTGFLGDRYSGSTTFFGYTTLFSYRILDPAIPAIEWGDGSTLDHENLTLVSSGPPRTYRGSFTHTYPDTSTDRTIRVGAHGLLGYADAPGSDNPALPPVTGNAIYANAMQRSYRVEFVGDTTYSGVSTRGFRQPMAVGITNTVVAAAALFPDPPPIPSASHWGLVVLSLGLGVGGAWLLRR